MKKKLKSFRLVNYFFALTNYFFEKIKPNKENTLSLQDNWKMN